MAHQKTKGDRRFDARLAEKCMTNADVRELFQATSRTMARARLPHLAFIQSIRFLPATVEDWCRKKTVGMCHAGLPDRYLSSAEVCEQLRISKSTLAKMRADNQIGYLAISEQLHRYDPREVAACVKRLSRAS